MHFRRSDRIYGAFGLVSGLLIAAVLTAAPDWEQEIVVAPIAVWLAVAAFGLALAAASACILGFRLRQLLVIPFVLAGWFCAVQIWLQPISLRSLFSDEVACAFVSIVVGGGIAALITALGIPIATRRALARRSYLYITGTGALVAAAWFLLIALPAAIIESGACVDNCGLWLLAGYALPALWQALVAMAIGRSISVRPCLAGVP